MEEKQQASKHNGKEKRSPNKNTQSRHVKAKIQRKAKIAQKQQLKPRKEGHNIKRRK